MGFDHMKVALSVGVQRMVRSDLASAGVIFTLDTDTGHRGVVLVTSSFGLGESVVQGRVIPDQFCRAQGSAPRRLSADRPAADRREGDTLVYDESGHRGVKTERVPDEERATLVPRRRGRSARSRRGRSSIEDHYSRVRGAGHADGHRVGQGRPDRAALHRPGAPRDGAEPASARRSSGMCKLDGQATALVTGLAIGDAVAGGRARVIRDPSREAEVQKGDVARHRR